MFCLYIVVFFILFGFVSCYSQSQHNESKVQEGGDEFNNNILLTIATQLKNLEQKITNQEKKFDGLEDKINDLNIKIDKSIADIEKTFTQLIQDQTQQLRQTLHDDNSIKIEQLSKCSSSSILCNQSITVHYVILDGYIFGISVAHTPCYHDTVIPIYVHACDNLDVSVWDGCPPKDVSLLDITGRIVEAKLGDSAIAFGFSSGLPRAWYGSIVGELGKNYSGVHFTNHAFENSKELLFQGTQNQGQSGGAVVNGNGKL
jgi:hypothetical protein